MEVVGADVGVDGGEVGLVEEGEFDVLRLQVCFCFCFCFCFGGGRGGGGGIGRGSGSGGSGGDGDVEVESPLQDRSVRDRVNDGKGEEEEGFFEGPEDAGAEEE